MKKFECVLWIFGIMFLFSSISLAGGKTDYRPKFDKSAYKGTVWTHVNPWWYPDKPRRDDKGGANYAQKIYPNDAIGRWEEALKECAKYGINGWQFEQNIEARGYANTLKAALKAAKRSHSPIKFTIFMTNGRFTADQTTDKTIKLLKMLKDELATHPNIYRLDGKPVISVYCPERLKPEEWGKVIPEVEKECGKFIWLFNSWSGRAVLKPEKAPAYIREYLPYFDGVSQYANWTDSMQRRMFELIAPIMHHEFPQKIFEAAIHNTHSVHFHFGGIAPRLSEKYRNSWDTVLAADPDSICITNMFDHYENSLVLPCYERENFLLRYAQYQIAKWHGQKFSTWNRPELVLTNYISVLIGRQKLDFEVVAFPIESKNKDISVAVELADCSGKVLHTFHEHKLKLNKLNCVQFSVLSEKFATERAVIPRIVYTYAGKVYKTRFNPPTMLNPSIRTNLLFWSNSTKNALEIKNADLSWTLNGVGQGGTANYSESGIGVLDASMQPVYGKNSNQGFSIFRIMRNGLELRTYRSNPDGYRAFMLIEPSGALNYYHLEMENSNGIRVRTLPIWVTHNRRQGNVTMPIALDKGKILDIEIEKQRVPYFYYPINFDTGNLLVDASGYMHNGRISGSALNRGHLGYTGYYHYHNGQVGGKNKLFARDENGNGMLRMDGQSSIMIMGGTAFPGASTYEIFIRPREFGKLQGIFGTSNGQMNVAIQADGKLKVWRSSAIEGMGAAKPKRRFVKEIITKKTLELNKWVHIAVVYDLKEMKLYLNKKLVGTVTIPSTADHDFINQVTVGSLCGWVWVPRDKFIGDIRSVRIYGRNLKPEEFLEK